MNKDLEKTHKNLLQVHASLFKRAKKATTREEFQALTNEMQEVLHRVNVLQRQLFVQSTAAITQRVEALAQIEASVKQKIKEAESTQKLLQDLTRYLAKVDEIIDLAKSLAA